MKPSERRALEAEKRAAREAAEREKELTGIDSSFLQDEEKKEKTVKGDGLHREGFFSSHVRLITFIICMTLILTVLGPWGVDMLVDMSRKEVFGENKDDGTDMTEEVVLALAEKGYSVSWEDLEDYNHADLSYEFKDQHTGKKGVKYIREYTLGDMVVLRVEGYSLLESPNMMRLIDYRSGKRNDDIRKGGVTEFFAGIDKN